MKIYSLLLAILIVTFSCKNNTDSAKNVQDYIQVSPDEVIQSDAYKKMKTLCFSCHSPTAEMEMRMAPPMVAVKMHYTEKYDNQKDFITAIWGFMQNPENDKALMKGAVKKFGLMPYMPYKEKDIKAIAAYMYNNELEKPDWFDEHRKQKHNKAKMNKAHGYGGQEAKGTPSQHRKGPKMQGKAMAIATKKELSKNLMKAISKKGTAGAVEFCNIRAIPITHKKEKEFNATIKRASDKPRNPINKANDREKQVIISFKESIANGEKPDAIVDKNSDKFEFYYPIMTNAMCLQCHGEVGEDVTQDTYKTITLKYPEDMAVGYDVDQVRGIWHITFEGNSK